MRKEGLQKTSSSTFSAQFILFVLLISNHTIFLVQFGIKLHLGVFQKAEIVLIEATCAMTAF